VEIKLGCQPERKQTSRNTETRKPDYDLTQDSHPFWYIRRSHSVGEFNSEVVAIKTSVINSASLTEWKTDSDHHKQGMLNFEVTIPCIVNNEKVKGGDEIVLRSEKKPDNMDSGNLRHKRIITAFDAGAPKFQKKTE
jgi:hypothetical protein